VAARRWTGAALSRASVNLDSAIRINVVQSQC
jgi:hypothetical protein